MRKRIVDILLVSSIYESFIMEEDVRLSDQIYEEFHNLNLRTIPHISRASSATQALALLKERNLIWLSPCAGLVKLIPGYSRKM